MVQLHPHAQRENRAIPSDSGIDVEALIARTEIRWDRSDVDAPLLGVTGMYDDFTKKDQLTMAVDLILLR